MPTATTYVRFLASGLTFAGEVRRVGHVLKVTPEMDPDGIMSLSEKEQRQLWHRTTAFYETLEEHEYLELVGAPSVAPEPAPRAQTPPPPGADGDVERGGGNQPASSEPGHVPPAGGTPPDQATIDHAKADPDAGRWPWYDDANVDATLSKVADMAEAEAVDFLAYEQAHKARSGVLGPMKGV